MAEQTPEPLDPQADVTAQQDEQLETDAQDEQEPHRVLGTGATGDVDNPEAGGPWTGMSPEQEVPTPGETPRVEDVPEAPVPSTEVPDAAEAPRPARRAAQPTD